MPDCLPAGDAWRLRARTVQAMALLCGARLLVNLLPFRWWRGSLGSVDRGEAAPERSSDTGAARRLAVHVERGAARLPFGTKCLPRAMALGWLLHQAGIGYVLKFAARPAALRQTTPAAHDDQLHAWVEVGGVTVIGALPGPWLVVLTLRG